MYSLVDFNTQIECHASKNIRFDHWEHRSIIFTSSRSNSWLFCMQCCANKEFLSPVKIALLCSLVLDLRFLVVWPAITDKSSWDTPRKRPVSLNEWVFQSSIFTFDPFSPFQCCNHVTVSTERISTLKRGRGELSYQQKRRFLTYGGTSLESVCLAQMW